jgi:hypothetical protein
MYERVSGKLALTVTSSTIRSRIEIHRNAPLSITILKEAGTLRIY